MRLDRDERRSLLLMHQLLGGIIMYFLREGGAAHYCPLPTGMDVLFTVRATVWEDRCTCRVCVCMHALFFES
jgi:hypothetical protein